MYNFDLVEKEDLRPIDDLLFNLIYQDKAACQELLRTVFDDDGLIVESVVAQDTIPNLHGRGVRFDVLCTMSDGSERNVEVQRSNNDDHFRRIRYNGAVITAMYTPKGSDFKDITEVYIIYITEFDPIIKGYMVYHVDSVIRETKDVIDDGFHRLLINTTVNDGTRLARLMSNFVKKDFADEEFPELSKQMKYFKHDEEGEIVMSERMERIYREIREKAEAEGRVEGRVEGRAEGRAETIEALAALGRTLLSDNKTDELNKAFSNADYMDALLKQHNL